MAWILSKEKRTIYRRRFEQFWDEYKRKKVGLFGIIVLSLFIILAVFAPWLTPYDPIAREAVAQRFAMPQWVTIFPPYRNYTTSRRISASWDVQQGAEFIKGWGETANVEYAAKTTEISKVILNYTFTHSEIPPNEFYVFFTWAGTDVQNVEYSLKLTVVDTKGKEFLLWTRPNERKAAGEVVSVRDFDPIVMIRTGYSPGKDNLANIIFAHKGDYTVRATMTLRPLSTPATISLVFKKSSLFLPGHVHGILGTDNVGSDIFSQLIYGARISLLIGLLAAITGTSIGLLVGIIAGYLGGPVDEVSMRVVDVLICLPLLPLLLALVSVFGKNIFYIVLFIGIFGWQGLSRVIRSQALSIRETAFIESAKASGGSSFYIMIKHIIPNVLPVAFASLVLAVPGAILFEASLSFLGFGDPRVPTWGKMLQYAFSFEGFTRMAWWWILPPGLAIIGLCLAFVFIGHAFDEVVNPRLRRRR